MTADQSPARPPSTSDFSVLPATAHMSPLWAAQPSWTVWVPLPICVTAVPDRLVPSATASTVVVDGCPSYLNCTAPPNAPAPLAEAAGADAAGAALGVDPAQPTTRSALTRTPRIDRMLLPPTWLMTLWKEWRRKGPDCRKESPAYRPATSRPVSATGRSARPRPH